MAVNSTREPTPWSFTSMQHSQSSIPTSPSSSTTMFITPTTMEEGSGTGPSSSAIVQVTIMAIILAIALLGNVCLILIIVTDVRLRTVHNKMVINLAACGLFTVIANGPFILSTLVKEEWIYGDVWCQFNGFTTSVYGLAVVLTLAMISINRYQIIGPVTPRRTPWITEKRIPFAMAGVWLVSMLFALPPAVGWSTYEFVSDRAICTLQWSTNISYTVFVFALGILFPFVVIFVSYVKIFRTVRANFRRMRSHRGSGKVYPRSEGGTGSSRRPSAGSFHGSSWSPSSRRRNNHADLSRNVLTPHHLQPPTGHGSLDRRINKPLALSGKKLVKRTVSDITGAIVINGRSHLTDLPRQHSLDNDIIMISPCASASTLDNQSDDASDKCSVQLPNVPAARVPSSDWKLDSSGESRSTEDSSNGSRGYKKREHTRLSGRISIQLTSVDEPKNTGKSYVSSPVAALTTALSESNKAHRVFHMQSALSVDNLSKVGSLNISPGTHSLDRPRTAGHYNADKMNNNTRRLSARSLRQTLRPPSSRDQSQTPSLGSSSASSPIKDELRMTFMVCAVLVSFILCWAPVSIVSFIAVLNVPIPAAVDKFAVFMMFLSSAVNPVIYGLMNTKFRMGFTRLLCGWRASKLGRIESNRSKTRSRNRPNKNGAVSVRSIDHDVETGVKSQR